MADTLEIFGIEYTGVTGIKATDDNDQIKTYIRPQGTKSITQNGTGIDVTEYASVDVNVSGGGQPNLQAKTYTVDSAGTATVTADSGYDGLSSVAVSVPSADPFLSVSAEFYTDNGVRKWRARADAVVYDDDGYYEGYIDQGLYSGDYESFNAVPANTTITPTTSAQTIGGANHMMEGAVTVAAMPSGTAGTPTATKGTVSNHSISVTPSVTNTSGYISGGAKTGTAVTVSASELVSGTYTVDSSGTKDVTNYASASVPAGTAGTPSASKGAVSNHSVSVTPSVTNATGWITGSTKTGTAVTVSASELVSGTLSLSANGTSDCTNYASVNVNIPFVTYYTGSSDPSSSLGSNGDIYLKTV